MFFTPHHDPYVKDLADPFQAAREMLENNPGKRVAIFTENTHGTDKVSRMQTESVLRGRPALDAALTALYKKQIASGKMKDLPGVRGSFNRVQLETWQKDPYVYAMLTELNELTTAYPGRILWVAEGHPQEFIDEVVSGDSLEDTYYVPMYRSTNADSYEEFAEDKLGEMRAVGAFHRRRDNSVKQSVREALKRKDIAGGVLMRGPAHQHIADELGDEGYSVEKTVSPSVVLFAPDFQLFREFIANPDRPLVAEELDIVIRADQWYGGEDPKILHRLNRWVEDRKAELGIVTIGRKELAAISDDSAELPKVFESSNPDEQDRMAGKEVTVYTSDSDRILADEDVLLERPSLQDRLNGNRISPRNKRKGR